MLVLRVSRPTPDLVSVQFVERTGDTDVVRGYAMPSREEWDGQAWAAIRCASSLIEKQPSTSHYVLRPACPKQNP